MNHIKILLNGKFFALKTIRDVTSYSEIDGCIKFFRELRAEEMALFQPHTLGKKVVTAYRYVETDEDFCIAIIFRGFLRGAPFGIELVRIAIFDDWYESQARGGGDYLHRYSVDLMAYEVSKIPNDGLFHPPSCMYLELETDFDRDSAAVGEP